MFDAISVIIFTLKNFIQRFTGIFSFIFDTYFPGLDSEEEAAAPFSFM